MTFEIIVPFEQVSVQSWDWEILTKLEQAVPNGPGSESALS